MHRADSPHIHNCNLPADSGMKINGEKQGFVIVCDAVLESFVINLYPKLNDRHAGFPLTINAQAEALHMAVML